MLGNNKMISGIQVILPAIIGLSAMIALSGFFSTVEARYLEAASNNQQIGTTNSYTPPIIPANSGEQADMEMDDDDDDGEMKNLLNGAAGNNQAVTVEDPRMGSRFQPRPAATVDLKASASHHHHGHHAKGWLDMGAWTGKKGAFGWYDKHPVGKGK